MKSNFSTNSEAEKQLDDIWMSADELLGSPSLPTTTAGIHYRAKQEHWQFRKREGVRGGKAIEYKLSSLPPVSRASILSKMAPVTRGIQNQREEDPAVLPNDGNEELILKLYRSLPSDESRRRFFSRLLVLTSELLESSAELENKEILRGSNSTESTNPTPQVSTHGKKAS
ncbi:hypothetical protein I5403_05975 [Citrobacter farmeri]|uniref:DNA-binding protein n=1 Tax=Citrobacter farmeri TaxID=67824 RepID=UPI001922D121|nr:DNA-binding protein [Citrobacter farmeri]MBJ8744064.1 hypothetical protein [Citrobacter farmeri]MBJ8758121.1 hypothetical protein [Citrobacter farmeri]